MDYGHLHGSTGEKRVFHCSAEPFEFCLTVCIIVRKAGILHTGVRLVLSSVQDYERHRTPAENIIELPCRGLKKIRDQIGIRPAPLMVAPCKDDRDILDYIRDRAERMHHHDHR